MRTYRYMFGLAYFRLGEDAKRIGREAADKTFDNSLRYLNKAIELRPEFPEAYWLRSRIFVYREDLVKAKRDVDQVKNLENKFTPKLFLYDMKIIKMIKTAVENS